MRLSRCRVKKECVNMLVITDKHGNQYFPASVYEEDDDELLNPLQEVTEVYGVLNSKGKILVLANKMDNTGINLGTFRGELSKENITLIQPMKYPEQVDLDSVMSLSEAAEKWGLADGSSIRKAIERGKFNPAEVRRSSSVWLVTYPAMQRVFGLINDSGLCYSIEYDEYMQDLYSGFLLDVKGHTVQLTPTEQNQLDNMYDQIENTAKKAYLCLKDGGRVIFQNHGKSDQTKVKLILNTTQEFIEWFNYLDERRFIITKRREAIVDRLQKL